MKGAQLLDEETNRTMQQGRGHKMNAMQVYLILFALTAVMILATSFFLGA